MSNKHKSWQDYAKEEIDKDNEKYVIEITEKKALDWNQSPIIHRKITLLDGDKIIFKDQPVFVAHTRLYQMGLSKLAKINLI